MSLWDFCLFISFVIIVLGFCFVLIKQGLIEKKANTALKLAKEAKEFAKEIQAVSSTSSPTFKQLWKKHTDNEIKAKKFATNLIKTHLDKC